MAGRPKDYKGDKIFTGFYVTEGELRVIDEMVKQLNIPNRSILFRLTLTTHLQLLKAEGMIELPEEFQEVDFIGGLRKEASNELRLAASEMMQVIGLEQHELDSAA